MAETTIGWTATRDAAGQLHPGFTFNPWIGCTEDEEVPGEMSPECAECYAREGQNHRVSKAKGLPLWGASAHRQVTSVSYWMQPLRWNRLAAELGVRLKVFCASLCDVFEDFHGPLAGDTRCWSDLDDVREELWHLIEETPKLDWLLLTKRPQNVLRMVESGRGWLGAHGWPRHVWVGATAGTRKGAARRLPELLKIPAPVRFVSYEPALELVDFAPWLSGRRSIPGVIPPSVGFQVVDRVDWLIVGGESGRRARPFDLAWARSAIAQGRAAGRPVFVKQMGSLWAQAETARVRVETLSDAFAAHPKGEDPAEWPEDLRVQEWPGARR